MGFNQRKRANDVVDMRRPDREIIGVATVVDGYGNGNCQ